MGTQKRDILASSFSLLMEQDPLQTLDTHVRLDVPAAAQQCDVFIFPRHPKEQFSLSRFVSCHLNS